VARSTAYRWVTPTEMMSTSSGESLGLEIPLASTETHPRRCPCGSSSSLMDISLVSGLTIEDIQPSRAWATGCICGSLLRRVVKLSKPVYGAIRKQPLEAPNSDTCAHPSICMTLVIEHRHPLSLNRLRVYERFQSQSSEHRTLDNCHVCNGIMSTIR